MMRLPFLLLLFASLSFGMPLLNCFHLLTLADANLLVTQPEEMFGWEARNCGTVASANGFQILLKRMVRAPHPHPENLTYEVLGSDRFATAHGASTAHLGAIADKMGRALGLVPDVTGIDAYKRTALIDGWPEGQLLYGYRLFDTGMQYREVTAVDLAFGDDPETLEFKILGIESPDSNHWVLLLASALGPSGEGDVAISDPVKPNAINIFHIRKNTDERRLKYARPEKARPDGEVKGLVTVKVRVPKS